MFKEQSEKIEREEHRKKSNNREEKAILAPPNFYLATIFVRPHVAKLILNAKKAATLVVLSPTSLVPSELILPMLSESYIYPHLQKVCCFLNAGHGSSVSSSKNG